MSHSTCYNCGNSIAPTALFCKHCHAALLPAPKDTEKTFSKFIQRVRKCPHCKREYTAGVSTCPQCKVATMIVKRPGIEDFLDGCMNDDLQSIGGSLWPRRVDQKPDTPKIDRSIIRLENGNIKVGGIEYTPTKQP